MKDRRVGPLRCREVLELLSDYVDGSLAAGRRQEVERHLKGCRVCEQFGGEIAAMVDMIRNKLAEPPPLENAVERRLRRRLDQVLASEGGSSDSGE